MLYAIDASFLKRVELHFRHSLPHDIVSGDEKSSCPTGRVKDPILLRDAQCLSPKSGQVSRRQDNTNLLRTIPVLQELLLQPPQDVLAGVHGGSNVDAF